MDPNGNLVAHWYEGDNRFKFSDWDGESLEVRNHQYMWTAYDNEQIPMNYIALNYEGEGPVVMEYDEARLFVEKLTELLDRAEKNMIE